MPTRAAILTGLGQPDPKPYEFEPLASRFEESSIKIGLEGHGAVVVNVHAAARLANAIRSKVPDRAGQIDACVEQAARYASAVDRPQKGSPGMPRYGRTISSLAGT